MKKSVAFMMACVLSLGCLAGCGEPGVDILDGLKDEEVVYLDYSDGFDSVGNYNNKLYSLNQTDTIGGDPGAIFVPKERDSKNGGYYYVYTTSGTKQLFGWDSDNNLEGYDEDVEALGVRCFRSKDLCSWELAGSEHGYSIIGKKGDWEEWTLRVPCAPEVVYNATEQKYYMYYNMISKLRDNGELTRKEDETPEADKVSYPRNLRNYVGIAVSDSPCGPFYSQCREETVIVDGKEVKQSVPCINFVKEWNLEERFPMEDISPFLDDDGTLYLYLKSPNNGYTYVMRMTDDWTVPDYSTFTAVLRRGYATIDSPSGKDAADVKNIRVSDIVDNESIVEGPNVLKYKGEYFLTFSMGDFLKQSYAVYQAKSKSPLGPFHRVGYTSDNRITGLAVVDGVNTNNFKGTGHHCFVYDGQEWYNVYHAHQNIESFGWERYVHADRVVFIEKYGETIMTTNGPSKSLQWLPDQVSEYKNLAGKATITAEGGEGAQYLNDGVIPFYGYNENDVFTADGNVTVTLTFDVPVKIVSVMVFNAYSELSAFSKINAIAFELAEKSDWMTKNYKYAAITGLEFPTRYYDEEGADSAMYKNCASCVAEFNEITVKSITIAISREDRIKEFDKQGNINTSLNLTEIAVLGR